ncbi:MAG: preprotein translocase subunit SecY [Phycisphaerales bacterium]|nr:preprotein translocase subunit SecY [Phycisphaerales bacterium]
MLQALVNVFKIAELRSKILFTLGMLAIFRLGHWIPLPGVNQEKLEETIRLQVETGSAAGKAISFVTIFGGGAFGHSTIFGLGIMPYISAGIIFQLIGSVSPRMKALQQEGPTGRQKIQEWTRLATIALCIIQGIGWLKYIQVQGLVYQQWAANPIWWVMAVAALTAGCLFLMWLGEQIDKFGIGNGVSLIIAAGILARMPNAVMDVYNNFDPSQPGKMGYPAVFFLLAGFVLVVAGSVVMTVAQRRIPIQQAKHTRGRKVFGGQKSYLPLRINHGGVMPVIFASSLMIFPAVIFQALAQQASAGGAALGWWGKATQWLGDQFSHGQFPYVVGEVLLIYFFSYFWITVQFNPEEMAKQLRDNGSFIPGLRPGPRTAEYLETVMERITFVGAAFLAVIAVAPMVVNGAFKVSNEVTQFLGGTGLLIVVSVVLDFIQRVEANLLMRNYAGFLGGSEATASSRLRGAAFNR